MAYDRLNDCPCSPTCCWSSKKNEPVDHPQDQALGRSKAGFSTKLHASCERSGRPVRFILTGGQRSDYTQALALIEGIPTWVLIADKGYDAASIVQAAHKKGAQVVIPSRATRKCVRSYDKTLYKHRNLIERMFNKLNHFRRVATRYDKLAESFLGWVTIAGILLWLK